ncbi:MAG: NHLP leader peptide family RiPP precursor [Scytonematopsis contorta HA4267-MV1]|nr:NHLP leader peptide family RiPP precursor [Scytonematopsis contorta HA4267-MV1]
MSQAKTREDIASTIIARSLEDGAYRQELLNNPAAVKEEIEKAMGQTLPNNFQVRVVEETSNMVYLVLPPAINSDEQLSEEQLEAVAGGWTLPCMFGSRTIHI